jgi:hypothetical protein
MPDRYYNPYTRYMHPYTYNTGTNFTFPSNNIQWLNTPPKIPTIPWGINKGELRSVECYELYIQTPRDRLKVVYLLDRLSPSSPWSRYPEYNFVLGFNERVMIGEDYQ